MILEERFDNYKKVVDITCPTLILHGLNDKMVPYQDSLDMLTKGFLNSETHLFLRDNMGHNQFDYEYDLIRPLYHFFAHLKFEFDVLNELNRKFRNLKRNGGYVDEKDNKYRRVRGYKNKSRYYNNF